MREEQNHHLEQRGLSLLSRLQTTNVTQKCPYCSHPELLLVDLAAGKHEKLHYCSNCKRRYVLLTEVKATTLALRVEGEEAR